MRDREEAKRRAKELVARMTIDEKASQLKYDAAPIQRLNIPGYNWWNEALHGVARAGTATVFPQAIGMAATFDCNLIKQVADAIATEGRAKYNQYSQHEDRDIYKGLTFWSPNVNIFRDPRWGRGHETYGEDPYLTSRLGVAFVEGLQGDGPVMKAAACAKHFAVHSGPEALRHEFNAVASKKDMEETYLPAFESLVKEADVESIMGAYNRTNGEPCCANKVLMKEILRDKWGFQGHYVSDCWAIRDFHEHHMVTTNAQESAALALKTGCDLNCGNTYLHIMAAYKNGLLEEADITRAAERLFTTRFLLGEFDGSEYDSIPYEKVECEEHIRLSLETAVKSTVLLKNDQLLPLNLEEINTIGVIGPNANSRIALQGNYYGTSSEYTTVLEGIKAMAEPKARVYFSEGCHLWKDRIEGLAWRQDRLSEAVIVAEQSDVVVLCLGLDESLEGEELDTGNNVGSGDKPDLKLPLVQQELMERILQVGKPTILILMAGSAIDLNYADENMNAILQVWYPGARGGKAVADILFGKQSPSGKLPVTFYKNLDFMPEFTDYSMKNRTYRYMQDEALYPFGFGLNYGNAQVLKAELADTSNGQNGQNIEVEITNFSDLGVEEVVQIYVKNLHSEYAVPNHSLYAFKRVVLDPNQTEKVMLTIPVIAFTVVDEEGNRKFSEGNYMIYAGLSQPDDRSIRLTGQKPIEIQYHALKSEWEDNK